MVDLHLISEKAKLFTSALAIFSKFQLTIIYLYHVDGNFQFIIDLK